MSIMAVSATRRGALWALALVSVLGVRAVEAQNPEAAYYGSGDFISPTAFVTDREGRDVTLRGLLAESGHRVNVLYIFGGGDLGSGNPGHLWCPDSFEDIHILRTLAGKYAEADVSFIAVAEVPVYHSQMLGAPAGVFFNEPDDSRAFARAKAAFVDSTMAAFDDGIIPVEPYFDLRFRLNMKRTPGLLPGLEPGDPFGPMADWMGAFRDPADPQLYGVPSLWFVSNDGEILADVYRGNVYHPHDADVSIRYTFADVDATLQALLAR
jgi:hypothetical protein